MPNKSAPRPKPTQRTRRDLHDRNGLVLIGATALGLVILLGAIKFPSVSIAAKLATDEVKFRFKERWSVNDVSARSVTIVNADHVDVAGDLLDRNAAADSGSGASEVEIR